MALRSLVPYSEYIPDFLTPPLEGEGVSLRDGIDRVLVTPRARRRRGVPWRR